VWSGIPVRLRRKILFPQKKAKAHEPVTRQERAPCVSADGLTSDDCAARARGVCECVVTGVLCVCVWSVLTPATAPTHLSASIGFTRTHTPTHAHIRCALLLTHNDSLSTL